MMLWYERWSMHIKQIEKCLQFCVLSVVIASRSSCWMFVERPWWSGSVLNQQLVLDNRFTRISQCFGESDGVEYYSAYSNRNTKTVWTALFTKLKTDKAPSTSDFLWPSFVHPGLFSLTPSVADWQLYATTAWIAPCTSGSFHGFCKQPTSTLTSTPFWRQLVLLCSIVYNIEQLPLYLPGFRARIN